MRREFASGIFAFGGGSAFWLLTAYVVESKTLGLASAFQAPLAIVIGACGVRTYDLFFNLKGLRKSDTHHAFQVAIRWEALAAIVATLISLGLLHGLPIFANQGTFAQKMLAAVFSGAMMFSGALPAYARARAAENELIFADIATGAAALFAAGVAIMTAVTAFDILLLSSGSSMLRPCVLALLAVPSFRFRKTSKCEGHSWRADFRFLLSGQVVNALKNNIPAFEMVLLTSAGNLQALAIFRVARAFLNMPNVCVNIIYQRGFKAMANAPDANSRYLAASAINRQAFMIWVASAGVSIAAGFAFGYFAKDQMYVSLYTTLPLLALSLLPAYCRQGDFALLSVTGAFHEISVAYIASILFLLAVWLVLSPLSSLVLFIGIIGASNVIRVALLGFKARKQLPEPQ